ncbi:DUF427 domain-containing protein [Muricoccus aerilatus]|uniref:DUF427 domain-containing protein n=1 Tax=Muricoccus aerilatus TaxID=452982 RepID=UPI0005C188F8|nr:DUF427 domain-containing protein [Roseomonas aerilata]
MKIPGPDHPISIEPNQNRVRVTMGGTVLADSTRALTLREASLPPVHYLPRQDAEMSLFERTPRVTHCPYKGGASYYTLRAGERRAENAVWSYEAPFPAVAAIAGHLAFYPDRVEITEIPPAQG